MAYSPYDDIPTYDKKSGDLFVVIETPQGSRNKYKFDTKLGVFRLGSVLTAGTVFPYDFGFIPGTEGGDGDPLDVLVLLDEPVFPGCVVKTRIVGAIEADQTERDGTTVRNDRLIAVSSDSHIYSTIKKLSDISTSILEQIEQFFIFYNRMKGRQFKPIKRLNPTQAKALVFEGQTRYKDLPIKLHRPGRNKPE